MTVRDGKIESISLDETKEGKSKKELGEEYNMKSMSSLGKEWDEQVAFLEQYIVKKGIDAVELTSDGYAKNDDVLAGCTINIGNMVQVAKDAKANAEK